MKKRILSMLTVFALIAATVGGVPTLAEESPRDIMWSINSPRDSSVTQSDSGNHLLRLELSEADRESLIGTTTARSLRVAYLPGQTAGSARRVVVWTDLGVTTTVGTDTFAYATAANLSAGRVVRTDPRIEPSDNAARVAIPANLLYAGGTTARFVYVLITTDNINADLLANQRGGNEFARLDSITLMAPAHLQPPIRGSDLRNFNMTPGASDTEMRFTWHSGSPTGGLRIREQGATAWREIASENPRPIDTRTASDWYENNYNYFVHQMSVSGLTPDTVHEYEVVWDNGSSEVRTFRTAGADSFHFIAVGDPQIGSRTQGLRWANTLNTADSLYPGAQFVMSLGDQLATRYSSETYNALTRSQYMYDYLMSPPQLRSMPFSPTVGNHDGWSSPNSLPRVNQNWNLWHDHYNTPLDAANVRQFATTFSSGSSQTFENPYTYFDYYYRWGNVLFIHLNSCNQADWHCRITGGSNNLRRDWFRQVVEDNSDAAWKVVNFHHAPYSVSTESWILNDIRRNWVPEFERAGVDIVFNGHDHVYARSHHMLGNERQLSQQWLNDDGDIVTTPTNRVLNPVGITFIALNTASGHNNRASAARPDLAVHSGVASSATGDFSIVSVTPDEFSVVTYRIATDGTTRTRIDSYSMVKSPCEVCDGLPCVCEPPPAECDECGSSATPCDCPIIPPTPTISREIILHTCEDCGQVKQMTVTTMTVGDAVVVRRAAKRRDDGQWLTECSASLDRS